MEKIQSVRFQKVCEDRALSEQAGRGARYVGLIELTSPTSYCPFYIYCLQDDTFLVLAPSATNSDFWVMEEKLRFMCLNSDLNNEILTF